MIINLIFHKNYAKKPLNKFEICLVKVIFILASYKYNCDIFFCRYSKQKKFKGK